MVHLQGQHWGYHGIMYKQCMLSITNPSRTFSPFHSIGRSSSSQLHQERFRDRSGHLGKTMTMPYNQAHFSGMVSLYHLYIYGEEWGMVYCCFTYINPDRERMAERHADFSASLCRHMPRSRWGFDVRPAAKIMCHYKLIKKPSGQLT